MATPPEKMVQSGVADSNQTRPGGKDPVLPANELLDGKKPADPKLLLLPAAGVWPKHVDLAPLGRPGPHHKGKKGSRDDRLPVEHNSEKTRSEDVPRLNPPFIPSKVVPVADAGNRTQKATSESPAVQSNNPPPSDSDIYTNHNSRSRVRPQPTTSNSRAKEKENASRRLDPEENRPGKSRLAGDAGLNVTRPFVLHNRRGSSLLYHFDILKKGSERLCVAPSSISQLSTDPRCPKVKNFRSELQNLATGQ